MFDFERSGKFFSIAGIILCILAAGYFFLMAFQGDSKAGVLVGVPMFAGLLFIAAGIAFNLLLEGPSHDFIFGLLGSRTMLKKAPPLISQVEKLLQQNQPDSALLLAQELYQQHPDSPELAWLIARIQIDSFNAPAAGLAVIRQYFDRRRRGRSEEHLEMIFYYADHCESLGQAAEAARMIRQELKRRRLYSRDELRLLRQRLESLPEASS